MPKALALVFDDALHGVPLAGRQVLVAGRGTDPFSQTASAHGAVVTSVDGDLAAIASGDAAFELVLAIDPFAGTRDPERAVRELVRVLGPGGTLVLVTPNRAWRASWRELQRWLELRGVQLADQRGFNAASSAPGPVAAIAERLDALGGTRAGRAMAGILVVARRPSAPDPDPRGS
jgi:SAM-dependent methyltransferase